MKRNYFTGFNGLRTFAITMVIACHVGLLSPSSGGIGNKIFFCLSGFLAFFSLKNSNKIKDILRFYVKKIVRILPSYYILIVFVAIVFHGVINYFDFHSPNSLILNMLFIKNFGHLWFLQQIMLMYLVAPLLYYIFILMQKLFLKTTVKSSRSEFKMFLFHILSTMIMLVLAYLEKHFLTADVLHLSGIGSHAQFSLWIFIIGFAFAILYNGCINLNLDKTIFSSTVFKVFSTIYIIAFFALLFVFVIPRIHDNYVGFSTFFDSEIVRSFLSGVVIFFMAISQRTILTKILDNALFTIISDVSFEIYIIHYFLLSCFNGISIKRTFIGIYLISLCIAYCVHILTKQIPKKLSVQKISK